MIFHKNEILSLLGTMSGIEFQDEDGMIRSICLEAGCIPFGDDSDVEAFLRWTKTDEGRKYFGYDSEGEEHFLSDKYPFNPETGERGDEDDYIDWGYYEKCRHGCYRQFWYSGKHDCCYCNVISCSPCARQQGSTCIGDECDAWICGRHKSKFCPDCKHDVKKEAETNRDDDKTTDDDDDQKPAAKSS